ncbi:MAG: hypothetical protein GXO81_03510 [Chlorobi bacterium]|nr:hypothetical protein [Chlorobiota bacterium]
MKQNWDKYYADAMSYYKTAIGSNNKGNKLGSLVMYNVISLSIENYLTAVLMKQGALPKHSGINSMIRELKGDFMAPESFIVEGRFLNKFMNFCSLDIIPQIEPSNSDIARMISFLEELKVWVEKGFFSSVEV